MLLSVQKWNLRQEKLWVYKKKENTRWHLSLEGGKQVPDQVLDYVGQNENQKPRSMSLWHLKVFMP